MAVRVPGGEDFGLGFKLLKRRFRHEYPGEAVAFYEYRVGVRDLGVRFSGTVLGVDVLLIIMQDHPFDAGQSCAFLAGLPSEIAVVSMLVYIRPTNERPH